MNSIIHFAEHVHNVNLKGAFFAAQAALLHLSDNGTIVFTGSIGSVLGLPGNVAYAAAKAGMRAVARIFATELALKNIRVNVVSPGPTETPLFYRNPGMSEETIEGMRAHMREAVPLKRIGEPQEVAKAVLFLASDEASFINGSTISANGGQFFV